MIRSGRLSFALAGGVDTYRDLYVLGTLDMEKRVKSGMHLDGFIPGEGAASCCSRAAKAAQRAKLAPLAYLIGGRTGRRAGSPYSDEPYRGEGLASVVRQLVESGDVPRPIREVYSSMNGESHWAKEWGVSFIRNREAFDEGMVFIIRLTVMATQVPACGPLMVGLAALGISGRILPAVSARLLFIGSGRAGSACCQ